MIPRMRVAVALLIAFTLALSAAPSVNAATPTLSSFTPPSGSSAWAGTPSDGSGPGSDGSGGFPVARLGAEADKQAGPALPRLMGDGAMLTAPLQDIQGVVTPGGLQVESTSETEGDGAFSLVPRSLSRGVEVAVPAGVVSLEGDRVVMDRHVLRGPSISYIIVLQCFRLKFAETKGKELPL